MKEASGGRMIEGFEEARKFDEPITLYVTTNQLKTLKRNKRTKKLFWKKGE